MKFTSTRKNREYTSAQAILEGLSADGGLFVPADIPNIASDLEKLLDMDYNGRALYVLNKFLTDFSDDELKYCVENAYNTFDNDEPAPVKKLSDTVSILELWHGPTCAFKDIALQILPHLLTVSAKKTNETKTAVILVATSGDTGKAALEGFRDIDNTKIIVFYPQDGVSVMQKLQMTTQEGGNVAVCAVNGNFDDAQSCVKEIFKNKKIAEKLLAKNMYFSSANSINFGRLVPQFVYYVSSYLDMVSAGTIKMGEAINTVVPTGNFGNILAAYYAKKMGIPIKKLICASNKNKILTDFINTGVYDRNRNFYTTISPSMDILISSNLERLLYELTNYDTDKINMWMDSLSNTGKYEIDAETKQKLIETFIGGYCDDVDTKKTIKSVFEEYNYLIDTHTAVAVNVYNQYKNETKDDTKTLIVSTASPYKFPTDVLAAFEEPDADEKKNMEKLLKITNTPVPTPLCRLYEKEVLHGDVYDKDRLVEFIEKVL